MTAYALIGFAAAALFYGSLQLWIGSNYPGERPRWSDVLPFCAALFAAVFYRGTASADSHAKAKGVVEP